MSKKNNSLNSFEALASFAYSTNKDYTPEEEDSIETLPVQEQQLEAVFSNKGRGGKTVTIIRGFIGTEDDLKLLAKKLKNKCGVGGSTKDQEIIIQGNYRDKIMEILKADGYKVKRVGG